MPQRKYIKERTPVTRTSKRITLPIQMERYTTIVNQPAAFRHWLDEMIQQHAELFPARITAGYTLHDRRGSAKLSEIHLRRIRLKAPDAQGKRQVFTIAPSGVLPYLTGYTDEVEKALFLRRFGVPCWALRYVFGRDEQYWYRLLTHLGGCSLVQSTIKQAEKLPQHLLADEKFVRFNGQEAYVATTVGEDCVLGAAVSLSADTESLTEAYQGFQQEAQQIQPGYSPETVNTDGWAPTQKAWQALFPQVVVMECFLHAFLKIKMRCRKTLLNEIAPKVWDLYRTTTPADFQQQAADLLTWAQQTVEGTPLAAIRKLCAKVERFILAFQHLNAHRTSNMLDRHMDAMARWLDDTRFFHGHWASAERAMRAWALFHNFWPYCPRAKVSQRYQSPAHKLNGFVYHSNWLHNMLISTSMAGSSR